MTTSQKIVTASADETRQAGMRLASELKAGDVVLLSGGLGAGKTCLVSGICRALGCDPDAVSSPTFTLVNQYQGRDLSVFHIDLYRLNGERDLESLGLEETFDRGGVCLVEWPERLGSFAPPAETCFRVTLAHAGGDRRELEISRP
jgi:tRNA threonylcarbamoyladenosine biosynthesis protein TsaE